MIAEMVQGNRIQQTMCKPWGKPRHHPCMTDIFPYFCLVNVVNVLGKYAIHGSYGFLVFLLEGSGVLIREGFWSFPGGDGQGGVGWLSLVVMVERWLGCVAFILFFF